MDLKRPWSEYNFIAFDTETSGAYPLGSEVVEFGAVKWSGGQVVDSYQTLLKPSVKMTDFIIGIHGITNEMVEDAPKMKDKVGDIRKFLEGSVLMAHHAPFDLGFMAADFERYQVPFPTEPVLCTSLLARKLIPESVNHKLQTLIGVLKLDGGSAHRAKDDANACLHVGLECMKRLGAEATLEDVIKAVGKKLSWPDYSVYQSNNTLIRVIVEALAARRDMDIVYESGSFKGTSRRVTPVGIVRNPDGDFLQATCHIDNIAKRFYLNKMKDAQVVF